MFLQGVRPVVFPLRPKGPFSVTKEREPRGGLSLIRWYTPKGHLCAWLRLKPAAMRFASEPVGWNDGPFPGEWAFWVFKRTTI